MKDYVIDKSSLNILLDRFSEHYKVFGPTKPGVDSTFDEIKSVDELHLDYISTVLPPKKFFLPPKETLFSFDIKKQIRIDQQLCI